MTKADTTSQLASPAVGLFLRRATPGQVSWYLSQGEPQALSTTALVKGEFVERIHPGLMGLAVGAPVATAELAIEAARAKLDDLLSRPEELESFDIVEAEIDDEAITLARAFDQASARIESIAHIGTMTDGSASDVLTEIVEDMDLDHPVSAFEDLPFMVKLLEEPDGRRRGELMEDFLMMCHDHGRQGFLIQTSVPEMRPTGSDSFSVHYGSRRTDVFYGSTYAVACRKALAWVERETEAMRTGERIARPSLRRRPDAVQTDDGQPTLI